MGDLTLNISRHEISCKCGCGQDTIDYLTVKVLQDTCNFYTSLVKNKVYIRISSGCRCLGYNRGIGSKDTSQHVLGRAIDFSLYFKDKGKIVEIPCESVYEYLDRKHPSEFGIGLYNTFVHLDTKVDVARRW